MGRRRWFKLFAYEMLFGKFGKLSCDEFGIIIKLFCMASDNIIQGQISINETVPYTLEQIAGVVNSDKVKLQGVLTYLEKEDTIKVKKDIIYITNWSHYQSEYERQKPYRNKEDNSKVTTQSYKKRLQTEVEVEVEVDKEVKKEKQKNKNKDTRVKVLIDYFFDKHLESKGTKIKIDGGKDGQKFTDLLKTFTQDEIKQRIDYFLNGYADTWMIDKPFTIGIFSSQFNKCLPPAFLDVPDGRPVGYKAKSITPA